MNENPSTPAEVWALIERADELIKYASNRDPAAAYAQAREILDRAAAAAREVPGAQQLETQARRRIDDLAALEAQTE